MSTDSTRLLMEQYKSNNRDFKNIIVVDNPRGNQASGWNVAISNATGDLITRIDAHASVPADFIKKNVKCIKSGEDITGGPRPSIIDGYTPWKRTLLLAENSMFGSSVATYRRKSGKHYVNSMFHATYKRKVFEELGGFNENLGRTEDNELHYRIRQGGYRFFYNSDVLSYQYTRSSLTKMLTQKYANGYWVGLTTGICPKCLAIYHFVPFAFVVGIIVTAVLAATGLPILAKLMWKTYWILSTLMAFLCIGKNKFNFTMLSLPLLFFLLHISYGVGTLVGLLKMPFWIKGKNEYFNFNQ